MHIYDYDRSLADKSHDALTFKPLAFPNLPDVVMEEMFGKMYPDTLMFGEAVVEAMEAELGQRIHGGQIVAPRRVSAPFDLIVFTEDRRIALFQTDVDSRFGDWVTPYFLNDLSDDAPLDAVFAAYVEQAPLAADFSDSSFGGGTVILPDGADTIDAGFGAYAFKNVPNGFRAKAIKREKDDFLAPRIDTSGQPFDASALTASFHEAIKLLNGPFADPVDIDPTLAEFERVAGYPMPPELVTLLRLHNGEEVPGLMSAAEILREWISWKEIYDDTDWALEDMTGNNETDRELTTGFYTTPYWVPFFQTGGANYVSIDYCPGPKGHSGQLAATGRDEDTIRYIAPNLKDFFDQIIAGGQPWNNGLD